MSKKLYLVETMMTYRMRYVVAAYEEEHALDEVAMNSSGSYNENWKEFSQLALPEQIFSSRELSAKDYMDMFDKDNDYLSDWSQEQKMSLINEINYED